MGVFGLICKPVVVSMVSESIGKVGIFIDLVGTRTSSDVLFYMTLKYVFVSVAFRYAGFQSSFLRLQVITNFLAEACLGDVAS